MNIAIFADLHGRITLCFEMCARWEKVTGKKIGLILQAGDMGAYPEISRIDQATRRHAEKDPAELGFVTDFTFQRPEVASVLDRVSANLVFVRGNHEDHEWLDRLERSADGPIFPVDHYKRLYCLKSGIPYVFELGGESVAILGIGRTGAPIGETSRHRPKYIQSYEQDRLLELAAVQRIDLLLSHDTVPELAKPAGGMEEIRLILDQYQPSYHFYGHTGASYQERVDVNEVTRSVKLADLSGKISGIKSSVDSARTSTASKFVGTSASMGILTWHSSSDHFFEPLLGI